MNVYYKLVNTKVVNYFVKINPPPRKFPSISRKTIPRPLQGCPTGIKKADRSLLFCASTCQTIEHLLMTT